MVCDYVCLYIVCWFGTKIAHETRFVSFIVHYLCLSRQRYIYIHYVHLYVLSLYPQSILHMGQSVSQYKSPSASMVCVSSVCPSVSFIYLSMLLVTCLNRLRV